MVRRTGSHVSTAAMRGGGSVAIWEYRSEKKIVRHSPLALGAAGLCILWCAAQKPLSSSRRMSSHGVPASAASGEIETVSAAGTAVAAAPGALEAGC